MSHIIKWEDKKMEENENNVLRCSLCQTPYQRAQKTPVRPFDRLITTSLDVLCKQHEIGCKWCGKIIDYENHYGVCPFVITECRFQGCELSFLRQDQQHHELECEHRLMQCELCGDDQKVHKIESHQQEICPEFEVKCPNFGCYVQLKRKEVASHLKDCLYERVSCDFYDIGCKYVTVMRRDLEQHNTLFNNQHLKLVLRKCMQTDQELKETKNNLANTQAKLDESNQKLEVCIAEKNEINAKLKKMNEENEKSFQNCFSAIEKSTKIISKYLLKIKEALNYERIVKEKEPFNSIVPLLSKLNRLEFSKQFLINQPTYDVCEYYVLQHKSVWYDFYDLNNINKELLFIQNKQQEQVQRYEEKMDFVCDSMEEAKIYQRDGELFFKLDIIDADEGDRLLLYFSKDDSQRRHRHRVFGILLNDDFRFHKYNNRLELYMTVEGYDKYNSDVYLCPYKERCRRLMIHGSMNLSTQTKIVWENYKSLKNEVLFHVIKKK